MATNIRAQPQVLATLLAFAELLRQSDPQRGLELATFVEANALQQRHVRERAAALLADLGGSSCVTSQDNRAERLEGLVAALLAPPT